MKYSKVLLNITAFFCFVFFALYTFSLVFIPIGIYCFLAGKKFAYKAENPNDQFKFSNKEFKFYVIFVSIFCFPFGLLSIIPYMHLASNNVFVSTISVNTKEPDEVRVTDVEETETSEPQEEKEAEVVQETNVETYSEKMEKFRKLQNFKEKGLITEEELEQAREQLFGIKEE